MATGEAPDQIGDLPKVGRPANRALLAIGVTRLDETAALGEAALLALHGVGPRAIRLLRVALEQQGQQLSA